MERDVVIISVIIKSYASAARGAQTPAGFLRRCKIRPELTNQRCARCGGCTVAASCAARGAHCSQGLLFQTQSVGPIIRSTRSFWAATTALSLAHVHPESTADHSFLCAHTHIGEVECSVRCVLLVVCWSLVCHCGILPGIVIRSNVVSRWIKR